MPFRSERSLKASMPGRAGYPENEPRPLAEFSHAELEHLMLNPDFLTPEGRAQLSRELERRVEENPDLMLPPEMHYDATGGDKNHPMYGLAEIDYTNYDPDWQDKLTGEPMDLSWRLLKEMYHGTKASPASLEEYGIQPRAEAPATQMGTNMSLFRDWWDAQHKDIEAENELRRRHNLPLTSREELLQEHEQRQADANKVWMSPNKSYASDYGRPGTDYSAGNVQSAGPQGSVATIDDTGLNLNVGRSPQMEYWHAGAIPQTAIQNIEPIQTGEPMDLAWRLLKTSNYRQAAGAIIRDSEGRVLLMRRSPLETSMHGMYELPGGKLEEGETPEDAARIEALEESGLPIVNLQALNPHVDHGMEKIYHGFTADIDPQHEGDVVRSDEHDNHMWIHPQEALNMQGHPDGMDVPFLSHHAANLFEQMVG